MLGETFAAWPITQAFRGQFSKVQPKKKISEEDYASLQLIRVLGTLCECSRMMRMFQVELIYSRGEMIRLFVEPINLYLNG